MADKFKCPMVTAVKNKKARMKLFLERLVGYYSDPECALHHHNAFELTCATILSAQCTDRQVNIVTPVLFKNYPTPQSLAAADQADVEKIIHSTGFYKNKASNLIKMAKAVVSEHGGEIPSTMEELVKLPGVGRKTANVVLGNAFGIPGMVVDTHVIRISNRLGFVSSDDPVKIEQELMAQVPEDEWTNFSHRVIFLGREFCNARKPACDKCIMNRE